MAEKKKQEKLGRRIKNWVLDRDYVFLCLFFAVVLGGAATYLVFQEKKTPLVITTGDLVFSKDNGFYGESLDVEIFPKKDGEVRYNLNGDDITNTSESYSGAIRLEVPENGYKVYTLGAALCGDMEQCGDIERKTYVLGKNLDEDVDLDIISITSSQKNLYDYEYGIMVPGKTYDENLEKELKFTPGNYSQRSEEWIRDANVIVFSDDGDVKMNGNYGLQISGGTSAVFGVKSFKILGNEKYGYQRLPFDFGDGVETYNSIRLRSGSQDQFFGNIRSSIVSRLSKESHFNGAPDTKRVVCFLNGGFYGIVDAQQNFSSSFLAKKFNLPNSDFVVTEKDNESYVLREVGVRDLFLKNLNNEENIKKLESFVDMDNFLQYYAMQVLWNNTDWPNNNYEGWRYIGEKNDANNFTDGKLRFLVYDTDISFYTNGNHNYFEGAISDNLTNLMEHKYVAKDSTFSNVMSSIYYRNKFIGILRELMNGPFETGHALQIVNEEAAKIDKQMQLFYSDEEYNEWQGWIELLKKAVSGRNEVIKNNVKKYFGVDL